jgi:hypothetical protein
MYTLRSPVKQCQQCGCHIYGSRGSYCGKCFNVSLVPVKCRFCGEQTLITQRDFHNEHFHVCMKCDWDNCSNLKCDICGNIEEDAPYSKHYRSTYKCKACCRLQLMKCADCSTVFYGPKRIAARPLCHDCRLNNYAPRECVACSNQFYFHKLKRPKTCICNACYKNTQSDK